MIKKLRKSICFSSAFLFRSNNPAGLGQYAAGFFRQSFLGPIFCRSLLSRSQILPRNRKHQLNAVFLIHPGRARIIINGYNISTRVLFFNFPDHPPPADMVRQTAKGLRADDILIAGFHQLQHFRRQEPALAHLHSASDHPVGKLLGVRHPSRRDILGRQPKRFDHLTFQAGKIPAEQPESPIFQPAPTVEPVILNPIINNIQDKAQNPRHIDFAVLRGEKILQVIVPQRGILDIDLPNYADLDLFFILPRDSRKIQNMSGDHRVFREFLSDLRSRPFADEANVFELDGRYIKIEEVSENDTVFGVLIDVTKDTLKRLHIEQERDYDLLTGLYNRRGLESFLVSRFRSPGELCESALVMIDADNLKVINDTYGHEGGDAYLKQLAGLLREFAPDRSIAARLGGDEFVLFLYRYPTREALSDAVTALEELQNNSRACLGDNLYVPLDFSFGCCPVEGRSDYQTLLKEADKKMYENKKSRKARRCGRS